METNTSEHLLTSSDPVASENATSWPLLDRTAGPLPVILALGVTCDIFRFIFGILAMAGNSLMITAMIKYKQLRTKTNLLLTNLCVVDCISGISNFLQPILKYTVVRNVRNVPVWLVFRFVSLTSGFGEIIALLIIGVERYIHIVHGLRYAQIVTMRRIVMTVVGHWLVVLLAAISITLRSSEDDERLVSYYGQKFTNAYLGMCVPMMTLFLLYAIICWKVRKLRQASVHPTSIATNPLWYKVSKMAAIVMGVYAVSVGPMIVSGMLLLTGALQPSAYIRHCLDLNRTFYYLQAWVNPIIYSGRDKNMMKAIRKLLHLKETLVLEDARGTNVAAITIQIPRDLHEVASLGMTPRHGKDAWFVDGLATRGTQSM